MRMEQGGGMWPPQGRSRRHGMRVKIFARLRNSPAVAPQAGEAVAARAQGRFRRTRGKRIAPLAVAPRAGEAIRRKFLGEIRGDPSREIGSHRRQYMSHVRAGGPSAVRQGQGQAPRRDKK